MGHSSLWKACQVKNVLPGDIVEFKAVLQEVIPIGDGTYAYFVRPIKLTNTILQNSERCVSCSGVVIASAMKQHLTNTSDQPIIDLGAWHELYTHVFEPRDIFIVREHKTGRFFVVADSKHDFLRVHVSCN